MSRPQRRRLDAPPEALDRDPLLRSVATSRLVGVEPATPVKTALHVMAVRDVRHLPVVDDHRCVGLVTEADLLRGIAAQDGPLGHTVVPVRDVAGSALVLPGDTRLSAATRHMSERKLDAVLVGSPDKLVGIVTATDVIHVWARLNRAAADPADDRHPAPRPGPPLPTSAPHGTEGPTS
jgi:CBS domain-containing protein